MTLKWESLKEGNTDSHFDTRRAKVPAGWLVVVSQFYRCGVTFYPDPQHAWDGSSQP